jgi:hypothetical protein
VTWNQSKETLTITKPADIPSPEALVYKVVFK